MVQLSLPYATALPELTWSIGQFKMPRSSMSRLLRAVFWTSRASEVSVFCSLVNASPPIWIHDSFFQCIIMHSHHYLCSIQTVLNLAKAILPSLLAKASLLAQMVKNLPAVQKTWV